MTDQPTLPSAMAAARPMPLVAPVTIAVFTYRNPACKRQDSRRTDTRMETTRVALTKAAGVYVILKCYPPVLTT
jgi:hypothetical protein